MLVLIGFVVKAAGRRVLDAVMPPAVTGAIVALILKIHKQAQEAVAVDFLAFFDYHRTV